jgi:acetoin utilization deacetylase AcuC-like enzyme
MAGKIVVVSCVLEESLAYDNMTGQPILSANEQRNDDMDPFNHPRLRRALILTALRNKYGGGGEGGDNTTSDNKVAFVCPEAPSADLSIYKTVHTDGLVSFLSKAWHRWDSLGEEGQDSMCAMDTPADAADDVPAPSASTTSPPLVPGCVPLLRDPRQRPSKHVMGQVGYYCNDTCTPVFGDLKTELEQDAAVVQRAVALAAASTETAVAVAAVVYAIPTHPGHHAAADSFGGYCYVNHAALAARLLQQQLQQDNINIIKVAVLDIDYHAGNGTASIFYEDPSVLVVSIHCDPDYDYPFHSGFADETGFGPGKGSTLHLPLAPGATWSEHYKPVLEEGMRRICEFGAQALVVSMGLDTYDKDPCTILRAGFTLQGDDYLAMGQTIGAAVPEIPTVFLQEGGYRMDKIGEAAADVVEGFRSQRQ